MADYTYKSYADQWKKAVELASDDTLTYVGAGIVREAQINAPIFIGNLRRSIAFTKPRTEGGRRMTEVGFAGGNKDAFRYAMAAEKGRRPGRMPPIDSLKPWVELKLGAGRSWKGKSGGAMYARAGSRKMKGAQREQQINSLAFLVARKIGREGSPAANGGKGFLLPAYDKFGGKIGQLYQRRLEAYLQQQGVPKPR